MKTAIDGFIEELTKQGMFMTLFKEEIKQAKKIENEQQIAFAKQCLDVASSLDVKTAYSLLDNLDKQINERLAIKNGFKKVENATKTSSWREIKNVKK